MKRIINILAAAALLGGLAGCNQREPEVTQTVVDLRYRCESEYNLAATGARAFTIVVTSSAPWSVTSAHPDWCIISDEEGEASPADAVHIGQGNKTSVRVQYYDNPDLDDRTDKITISSDYWTGKVITVNQKGIAYLTIPADEQEIEVNKAGGEYTFHVNANQKWNAKVTDGDWLSIADVSAQEGDGTVTVLAQVNAGEVRQGTITLFDRHDVAQAQAIFTQDGVRLSPDVDEIRLEYNELSATIKLESNTKWTVTNDESWLTIDKLSGEGDATLNLTLTQNDGSYIRRASVWVRSIPATEEEEMVEKEIVVKQAFHVIPEVHIFDDTEAADWKLDSGNLPTYVAGSGMLFGNPSTLQRSSMPFGDYTFYWKNINVSNNGVRIRTVFAYSDIEEIKFGLRINSSAKKVMYLDFNAASSGKSGKPEGYSVPEDLDFSVPHTFGCSFRPIKDSEYCHVLIYLDGTLIFEFDTSEKILDEVKWGTKISMYVSVDSGGSGDSAVLEKYEYSKPLDWGD